MATSEWLKRGFTSLSVRDWMTDDGADATAYPDRSVSHWKSNRNLENSESLYRAANQRLHASGKA